MKNSYLKNFWGTGFISVKALSLPILFVVISYLSMDLLGWREYTSFLSGLSPSKNPLSQSLTIKGIIYALTYFVTVSVLPVCSIAGLLFGISESILHQKKTDNFDR